MGKLKEYFDQNESRLMTKWEHYFPVYERYFSPFVGKEVNILEVGVFHGGSLQMWKDYFGPKAKIYGVDINPECKRLEEDQIEIFIGSQSDRKFLRGLKEHLPPLDIILDDGGHTMQQQIVTFEELYDKVKDNGIYMCEDVHTSYWLKFGGGHKRRGTFLEYCKNKIDSINAFHSRQSSFRKDRFTTSIKSVHFYDSIVVFEKDKVESPKEIASGTKSYEHPRVRKSFLQKMPDHFIKVANLVLRFLRLPSFIWK